MSVLYIDLKSLLEVHSIIVRDSASKVKYLINGYWGRKDTGFNVTSIYGDILVQIVQTQNGLIPHFEIWNHDHLICRFIRPLGNSREIFYLSQIHWLVYGNLNKMQYSITTIGKKVMQTKIIKGIPDKLQIKIKNDADEPVCLCLIAILNFWSQQHRKAPNDFNRQSLYYSEPI